jgi:hypothetical protein
LISLLIGIPSPGCAGSCMWPAVATTPGGSGRRRRGEPNATYLLFQLILRFCHRGNVLITSNLPVMDWCEMFNDQVVATVLGINDSGSAYLIVAAQPWRFSIGCFTPVMS